MKLKPLIPRNFMPQVEASQIPSTLSILESLGIEVESCVVSPRHLKPSQKILKKSKVQEVDADNSNTPVLVSYDNYVLDGHHRWAAYLKARKPIEVYKIYLPRTTALKILHLISKSTHVQDTLS